MAGTKLGAALVDKLLDKLGTDDQFRADFSKDPTAALQSLGAPADAATVGGCMYPTTLASKEQFQNSRQKYRDAMLGQADQHVFNLEA